MSLIMHRAAVVLICILGTALGRRVQSWTSKLQNASIAESRELSKAVNAGPRLHALAELLHCLNPADAFCLYKNGGQFFAGGHHISTQVYRELPNVWNQRSHQAPVMAKTVVPTEVEFFGDLKIPMHMFSALQAAGIKAPTSIQSESSLHIVRGGNVLLHSETGSGKTLAYLLPILSQMHHSRPNQLIIIVPSRELALQTAAVVEQVWPWEGSMRAFVMAGSPPPQDILAEMSRHNCPVLIATPRPLLSVVRYLSGTDKMHSKRALAHSGNLTSFVKRLRTIVMDEADALLLDRELSLNPAQRVRWEILTKGKGGDITVPEKFSKPAARVVQALLAARKVEYHKNLGAIKRWSKADRGTGSKRPRVTIGKGGHMTEGVQMVACSATVSYRLREELCRLFGLDKDADLQVVSPALFPELAQKKVQKRLVGQRGIGGVAVPQLISHTWVACTDDEEKLSAIQAVLSQARTRCSLLFMPDNGPLRKTVEKLCSMGIKAEMLHEAMGLEGDGKSVRVKANTFHALRASLDEDNKALEDDASDIDPSQKRLLVSTFGSARGLDLPNVDKVMLTSLPDASDTYLHVAGRTGRQGRSGAVLSLLTTVEQRQLGKITRDLGISIKQNIDVAVQLAEMRNRLKDVVQ